MGYSVRKRTAKIILGIAFNEQFSFERLERLNVTESHYSGNPGVVAWGADSRSTIIQMEEKITRCVDAARRLEPHVVPVVRCPKCRYMQSWMVKSAKNRRASRLALIPTAISLIFVIYAIFTRMLGLIDQIIWIIFGSVALAVVYYVGKYFILRYWNTEPNQEQKSPSGKRPALRMNTSTDKSFTGVNNVGVNMIDAEAFERNYRRAIPD